MWTSVIWAGPRPPDYAAFSMDRTGFHLELSWSSQNGGHGFVSGQAVEFEVIVDTRSEDCNPGTPLQCGENDPLQKCFGQPFGGIEWPDGTKSKGTLLKTSQIPAGSVAIVSLKKGPFKKEFVKDYIISHGTVCSWQGEINGNAVYGSPDVLKLNHNDSGYAIASCGEGWSVRHIPSEINRGPIIEDPLVLAIASLRSEVIALRQGMETIGKALDKLKAKT
jgi:hypothetical protein